jgi:hypothetical protein
MDQSSDRVAPHLVEDLEVPLGEGGEHLLLVEAGEARRQLPRHRVGEGVVAEEPLPGRDLRRRGGLVRRGRWPRTVPRCRCGPARARLDDRLVAAGTGAGQTSQQVPAQVGVDGQPGKQERAIQHTPDVLELAPIAAGRRRPVPDPCQLVVAAGLGGLELHTGVAGAAASSARRAAGSAYRSTAPRLRCRSRCTVPIFVSAPALAWTSARQSASRQLAVAHHLPGRPPQQGAGQRIGDAGQPLGDGGRGDSVQDQLGVGEVVVVHDQQRRRRQSDQVRDRSCASPVTSSSMRWSRTSPPAPSRRPRSRAGGGAAPGWGRPAPGSPVHDGSGERCRSTASR